MLGRVMRVGAVCLFAGTRKCAHERDYDLILHLDRGASLIRGALFLMSEVLL